MKKSTKTKRIKVKADLNQLSEPSDENSVEKDKEKENETTPEKESSSKNVYRCPKCFSIPFINVKDNENKVVIDCLNGHHIEMLFSEYMTSEFQKNVSKFECSQCGGDKNMKKLMQVCFECNKIFCKDCLPSHNKSSPNHHLNSIEKNDIICPLHKSKYSYYCSECKKNLCDECIKDKNDEHQLISFKNINLKNYELSELKSNLDKENEILIKIKKIFNDTLVTLSNKFNDIISYKFLCLKYKNNILKTYETKDTNYQIIDNLNHLKFITKDLKIEPEMNELDIIYELFNFLDSIEYNDENNNANNNSEDHSYSNINNSINMNENNKIIIDAKNKIEESEHEDDNDTEKENNPNEIGNKNSKKEEDENEKDDDEEEKKEEAEKDQEESNANKLKNKYNNKKDDVENSNEIHINKNINIVVSSTEDLVNQGTPDKTKKNVINKKKVNENEEEEEGQEKDEIKKKNTKESKDKERNKIENKENNDNNDVSESYFNENEENIYVYKSTSHIPVANEQKETIDKNENLSKTQNIDNEPKKRKKKLSKKKKLKQLLNPTTQTETESKTIIKTKKKVIKKGKSKDKLIQNEENKEDDKEKEELKDEKSKEDNNYVNNNIRIEVNESDSKDINNNNNVEENENDNNKKEDGSKGEDITDNYDISKTEENEKEEDNISNDIKIEEVPNTNHEEFKENKIAKKRIKQIKKKKKKKLNITKNEPQEYTQQIEIINTESKKSNNIQNSGSKKGSKKESLRYDNHDDEDEEAQENSDLEEQKIERHIEKHIEVVKDKNNDEDNKSKNSKNSKSSKKKITITKKINIVNSDQEDDEDEDKDVNIKKKMHININTDINEKNNTIDADMNRKIDKFNKIVNMDLELDSPMNRSRGSQRSQRIKKRKKIKKKKYLIYVDNNGTAKNPKPEEEKEEKQIKITKTTTLIRSRSKEKLPKDGSIKKGSPSKVIKNKEINFKIFQDGENSSFDENSSTKKSQITNIRTKKNIKNLKQVKRNLGANFESKGSRKMKMIQGKNNAAFLMENKTEVYFQEKDLITAKNKGLGIFETQIEYDRDALNRSMDGYGSYRNRRIDGYDYNYDEIKYLVERSNSYKKMRNYKKFNEREKINCMKFENGISCLLEVNPIIFAIGNLIGDILVINSHTYKEMKTIREHDGTIISLCLLHDKSILSCSADRKMLKIRINKDGTQYKIEFVFTGYENYIIKGIELMNTFKIITCSWDDKLFVWEKENQNNYKNSLIFNEGERVVDLLEININYFVSISESNELKLWSSDTLEIIDIIKNIKCIGAPNALCKINDNILCVLDYHEIQLIDLMDHRLVNKISVDDGNLSCIIKLNDNSILLAEDFNSDKYCVFYMKQFYYEYEDFKPISYKKDKFFKTNKNNDKEIRALVQFSNGVIVQGVTGEYNGNDSGDLFFYY